MPFLFQTYASYFRAKDVPVIPRKKSRKGEKSDRRTHLIGIRKFKPLEETHHLLFDLLKRNKGS